MSEKKTEVERELTKEEYFKKLEEWVVQARILQNATACFPYYLATNYPTYFTLNGAPPPSEGSSPTSSTFPNITRTETPAASAPSNSTPTTRAPNPDEGYEFIIAPLWKRLIAEMIDVILLLLLKVAITFTLLNVFDLDLSFEFDSDYLKKSVSEDDSKFLGIADLLTLSSDLFVLEILMKVFVCLYEAIWTMNGRVFVGGATPGKLLLRLRIVHVEVLTLPNGEQPVGSTGAPITALIYPAANPGFVRALLRAVAKNLVLSVLFPVCFVLLFLKNNRTFYDVLTKTVVVEENAAPLLRRR